MHSYTLCTLMTILVLSGNAFGHGMVLDPPNRSSMWRFASGFPINYDDNGLFCGGRQVQWELNDGRCGVCGDDFRAPQPRANENTGKYGTGIVGKTYNAGQIIKVNVLITANHMGWFQFSLCKLTKPNMYESEDCFTVLKTADGNDIYEVPSSEVGYYPIDIKLPDGVTCERCVLRWHYNAGNSWGLCSNGQGRLGCGPQENFRTCSDISIV